MKRNLTDHVYKTKPKRQGKLYKDSQKLEAVKLWLLTGNLMHTAAALNIPHPTVRAWRYSDWWTKIADELRTEDQIQLSNKLKAIAEKSLEIMADRLQNGDYIFNRFTGEMERKPVSLRDTTTAFNSIQDRKMKLDDKPKDDAQNKQVMDRLSALAQKFEEIANKRQPIQVTDVVYAIHEGEAEPSRESGVQGTIEGGATGVSSGEEPDVLPATGRPVKTEISAGNDGRAA